ncbi:alpha/beta hydrolase [Nocardioides sp.]|uniref:alpha/beta hydrolase n=1 Tax=Nocardioides sp. TaxID=35761 RepID=UPI003512BB67
MRLQKQGRRRPSRRSRAVSLSASLTLRPLTAVIPASPRGVPFSRAVIAANLAAFSPRTPGCRITAATGLRAEWITPPAGLADPGAGGPGEEVPGVLLYLHGSAYMMCSARTHRGLTTRLAAETGLRVLSVDYRLAPEHPFPAAADDVRAAWDHLRETGVPAHRIVVAGDSAGGHLALTLVRDLIADGADLPAGVLALSPVVDLSMGLSAGRERIRRDPLTTAARAARLLALYVGEHGDHPRLALAPDDLVGCPPVLIQAGGAEMLAADAVELTRRLRAAGVDVELDVWPDQVHVFQALTRVVPEAHRALREAAHFLRARLAEATPAAAADTAAGRPSAAGDLLWAAGA